MPYKRPATCAPVFEFAPDQPLHGEIRRKMMRTCTEFKQLATQVHKNFKEVCEFEAELIHEHDAAAKEVDKVLADANRDVERLEHETAVLRKENEVLKAEMAAEVQKAKLDVTDFHLKANREATAQRKKEVETAKNATKAAQDEVARKDKVISDLRGVVRDQTTWMNELSAEKDASARKDKVIYDLQAVVREQASEMTRLSVEKVRLQGLVDDSVKVSSWDISKVLRTKGDKCLVQWTNSWVSKKDLYEKNPSV